MRGARLILVSTLASLARTEPYEAYSVDSQYPPIAIAGEEFSFKLSNDTFKSRSDGSTEIQYEAFDLPSWLQFDSTNRVLSGTPSTDDLPNNESTSYVSYTLQGTDPEDEQKLNKTYNLALSKKSDIAVSSSFNLLSLLKNSGYTNGRNALKLSPGEIFNISFDRDTFTETSSSTSYYGRSALYHAPLPNWVFFDENNLKFSGTAPVVNSEIAPESSFSFSLIATDLKGYTGAEVSFDLVIGAHQFTTSIQNTLAVNVSSSGDFQYSLPLSYVYLDNEPVSLSNISSITLLDAPEWASISNTTLSGTLPEDISGKNLTVAIDDVYGDSIYLNFLVESTSKLFAVSSLPNANATQGEWFQYSLLPSQFTDYDNTDVSVSPSDNSTSSSWLSYHESNLTLMGEVPKSFKSMTVDVKAKQGSKTQQLSFKLAGVPSKRKTSSSSSSSSTSSATKTSTTSSSATPSTSNTLSETSTPIAPLKNQKKQSNSKTVAIACGVAIPLVVLLAALILFLLLWRRRKNKSEATEDDESSPRIGKPQLGNPANHPNAYGVSPFGDENSIGNNSTARRLGALNAITLDNEVASASDGSTMDEKAECGSLSSSSSDSYHDAALAGSTDALVPRDEHDQYFDPNKHTSSVYLNSEPTNRKSWRFSKRGISSVGDSPERNMRESYNSLNTVSTAELFNTQIARDRTLPKDPKKSSLGLRDSVFMGHPSAFSNGARSGPQHDSSILRKNEAMNKVALPNVTEHPQVQASNNSQLSESSSDDFIPVKQGEIYKWVERQDGESLEPTRKKSLKRLVSLPNKSGVGICNANDIEGQEPEMDTSLHSNDI